MFPSQNVEWVIFSMQLPGVTFFANIVMKLNTLALWLEKIKLILSFRLSLPRKAFAGQTSRAFAGQTSRTFVGQTSRAFVGQTSRTFVG